MKKVLKTQIFLFWICLLVLAVACSSPENNDDQADDDNAVDDDNDADDDQADDDDNDDDSWQPEESVVLENEVMRVTIWLEPFGIQLSSDAKGIITETLDYAKGDSLWYKRNGERYTLEWFGYKEPLDNGVALYYQTTEGDTVEVCVTLETARSVRVTLGLDHTDGWLWAGQDMQLFENEAIYGAVERINWWYDASEANPKELGTLDRRGQWFPMVVMGTIGVYTPFYHSSRGYGLFVDSTFYGFFDLGSFVKDRLRFFFQTEFQRDPILTYYLYYGPSHDQILDEYTAQTGRPFIPPDWAFLHWRYRDTHHEGGAELDGNVINYQVVEDITQYEAHNIPAGNYLIDRPWSPGEQGFAEFSWDEDRFPNPDAMRQSLFDRGYHLFIWGAPWAIGNEPGQNGWEAKQFGYHAPNSNNHIDFTNPFAYDWWKQKVHDFVVANDIHGWKLDRGDEDQPSFWWNEYYDGRTGAEMRNAYPVIYQNNYFDGMTEAWGDDFVNFFRAGWAGSQQYGVVWGGDTRGAAGNNHDISTDLGLRSAILSQLHCAFMGFPFWGSDTGGFFEFRDREVFARWLEFSAFSAIMHIGGVGNHAPWNMPTEPAYDPEMIEIYRYYTQLHHDLNDYMVEYANSDSPQGRPMARPLVFDHPDDPNLRQMWDQYYFGYDILVAPVWKIGQRQREVYIPEGQFADYWNPTQTITGPTTITADAALDRIPIYIKKGTDVLGRVW